MAINVQFGDVVSQGRAAYAAGEGRHNQFIQKLQLQTRELQQNQQRIDLAIEESVQRERMQQRQLSFSDYSQDRSISLADRDREQRLRNSNQQLEYSTKNQNTRQIIGEEFTNQRLDYSETQANARTSASLYVNRINTLSNLQGAAMRQAAQLQAAAQSQAAGITASERLALFNAGDARQRMLLGGQIQSQQQYQQAYLNNELQGAQSQRSLANQQEMLGYGSYADRDQFSQRQQFDQQLAEALQTNDYTPQQLIQRDSIDAQQIRLDNSNLSPEMDRMAQERLMQARRRNMPTQLKQSPQQRYEADNFTLPDGSNYNFSTSRITAPPAKSQDLTRYEADLRYQASQNSAYESKSKSFESNLQKRADAIYDNWVGPSKIPSTMRGASQSEIDQVYNKPTRAEAYQQAEQVLRDYGQARPQRPIPFDLPQSSTVAPGLSGQPQQSGVPGLSAQGLAQIQGVPGVAEAQRVIDGLPGTYQQWTPEQRQAYNFIFNIVGRQGM